MTLSRTSRTARTQAVLKAVRELQGEGSLVEKLADSSGLSRPMVKWGLGTSLKSVSGPAIERAYVRLDEELHRAEPIGRVVVVLSSNVFAASLRGILFPLLAGNHVVAKASSRDAVLPYALKEALFGTSLQDMLEVITFARSDGIPKGLLDRANAISVYGSDDTIEVYRQAKPARATIIPHGHGLGIAWVSDDTDLRSVGELLALDVAAYDQRGCLSPHAVLTTGDAEALAALLSKALGEAEQILPRGKLSAASAAEQSQWRGVAQALGTLHSGPTHSVSVESEIRVSPGYRNVAVVQANAESASKLSRFGEHLKVLGVQPDHTPELSDHLSPTITPIGQMQTPEFTSNADGHSPWRGLLKAR